MNFMRVTYKEVIPELKLPEKWKEILLNTGGTQSTLQDIKLPQAAGGYWYKDSEKFFIRNRFLSWQTTPDSIDISEWALDVNLKGSHVRCKVPAGTPPLNNVTIWEQGAEVVILVATISSVHRLVFQHPCSHHGKASLNIGVDSANSIFNDPLLGSANNPNNYHILTQTSTACSGVCSSLLNSNGEAVFAVWCGGGTADGLILVVMPRNSPAISFPLRRDSAVPRFLSGITGALRGKAWASEEWACGVCVSGGVVWALWSDGCLRAWRPPAPSLLAQSQPIVRVVSEQHKYILKQAVTADSAVVLVAYLSIANESEFVVIKPTDLDGTVKFTEISRIFGPQLDLVDYSATYYNDEIAIWAIWVKPDGENVVARNVSGGSWERAQEGRNYEGLEEMESPTAYVDKLLEPANFPPAVVRKALQVYRRAWCGGGVCSDQENLRDAVLRAVKARLQKAPHTPPHRCWSDLYSWCVQYMESLCKPLGLFVSREKYDEAWIVRGGGVSLVSKASPLHMILASPNDPPSADELTQLFPDPSIREDVWRVVRTAGVLEASDIQSLYPSHTDPFSNPNETLPPEIMDKVTSILEPVQDVQRAVLVLNDALRLDEPSIERDQELVEASSGEWVPYSSDLGVSIITEALGQMARVCVSLLRGCGRACAVTCGAIPGAGPLAVHYHAYAALLWLRSSAFHHYRRGEKDEAWRLALQSLGLRSDVSNGLTGGSLAAAWWRKRALNLTSARVELDLFVADLAYSLWAVSGGFEFGEWLATIRQPKLVETYVEMLEPWCEWNACSRLFILGLSFLDMGDTEKAYAALCKAAKGVSSEPFLLQIIGDKPQSHQQALVLYHLKVIKLFEIYEENNYVVRLAESAISIAERDDPNLTVFQWTVFSRRLQSGCVGRALSAAAALATSRARANAANTLIRTLGAEGRLSELVAAGARGPIAEELEKAAATRARLISPVNNVYCNYLYAEKIKRGHFRKAASVMYEQACRCQAEGNSPTLLSARWKCLLAAVNCLRLTPNEHAFIAGQEGNVLDLEALVAELKKARAALITPTRTNDASAATAELCAAGLVREAIWLDERKAIVALANHSAKSSGVEANNSYEELRKRLQGADNELLKEVSSSILGAGQYLPHWLFTQYLENDAASLVRVLQRAGQLNSAAQAACAAPENALPACDSLLHELHQHVKKPHFKKLYDAVNGAVNAHLQLAVKSSANVKGAGLRQLTLTT